MRVLIACEFSGVVRDAFRDAGHDAVSCDLRESETPGPHLQTDVSSVLGDGWDLMIAHPPCRYLASAGARWWRGKEAKQQQALQFVITLMRAPIEKIAIENPVGKISTAICPPDQYIQPWQFGHGEVKKTGLWLKNLPLLRSTIIAEGRYERVYKAPAVVDRDKTRARFYYGIAQAMAAQWGKERG